MNPIGAITTVIEMQEELLKGHSISSSANHFLFLTPVACCPYWPAINSKPNVIAIADMRGTLDDTMSEARFA